jgi:acyl carrier protein
VNLLLDLDLERVLVLVREHVGPHAGKLGPSTRAADVRGWDSVAMVNLLFALEETFGVEFTSAQMERANGVPMLLKLLQETRSA